MEAKTGFIVHRNPTLARPREEVRRRAESSSPVRPEPVEGYLTLINFAQAAINAAPLTAAPSTIAYIRIETNPFLCNVPGNPENHLLLRHRP